MTVEVAAKLRGSQDVRAESASGCRSNSWQAVEDALDILQFSAKKGADIIKKGAWSRQLLTLSTTKVRT